MDALLARHLARNYPLILAGGKQLGIKHGQFRQFDESQVRLADMYVSMMNAVGVETQQFGDSTRSLDELFEA